MENVQEIVSVAACVCAFVFVCTYMAVLNNFNCKINDLPTIMKNGCDFTYVNVWLYKFMLLSSDIYKYIYVYTNDCMCACDNMITL